MKHFGLVNLPGSPDEVRCGCGAALDDEGNCSKCSEADFFEEGEMTDAELDEGAGHWEEARTGQ